MRSIRTRLLVSFSAIITVLLALSVVFVFMHLTLIKWYKDITTNMIDEYRLTEVSTELTNSFITLAKAINDESLQDRYDGLRAEIQMLFSKLDSSIVNKSSQVAYLGLKNTVNRLAREVDAGINAVREGNISIVGSTYDTALRQSYFVAQNTGVLILNELRYAEQVQANVAQSEFWSRVLGIVLFVLTAIAAAVYSILSSRRIVTPLGKLTKVAQGITGGNFNLSVGRELLDERDETGILARSFNVMIRYLQSTIQELDAEKRGVEKKIVGRTHELQEEQARFLASIYSLPLGFILANTEHVLLLKNDSANAALGLPPGNFSIRTAMQALGDAIDMQGKIEECMTKKETIVSDVEHRNKFLKLFFAPIALSPGSDDMIGYVILLEDVTEARLLERTRDEFFAIASHELRTPLTAIQGNTELIQDFFAEKVKNKEVLSMISDIRNASARLITLVNDFLDVSRIEQHKIKFKNEPISVAAIAKEVVKTFTTAAKEKGLSMHIKTTRLLPDAFGDADHVRQVLINLVGNSVNYTKKGSITITLASEGKFLKTSVTDTGIGISDESKKLLFRKFQQAGRNIYTRDVTRGTGLGLYISKLLIEDMKGTIWLEKSEEEKGSTFVFTLPLASVI